ncbi:MAG: hypothetical protein ACXVKC_11370 [Candidatus Angelobacter sp.]
MFLVAAIVSGIVGYPSAVLAVASLVLLLCGAWRLSRLRVFMLLLIMIPLLIGFLLTGLDWHHPFLARYSAGLFSVVAVLLCMDAVRVEEWIEILRRNAEKFHFQDFSPVLIGTAVGIISLSSSIREQRACRKLARIYHWRMKSQASVLLDSIALPFYSAVESHEFIDEALRRWSSRPQEQDWPKRATARSEIQLLSDLRFGNSIFTARLIDLYDLPYFTEFVRALSVQSSILEPWEQRLAELTKGSTALIINGRTAQLTRRLLETGLTVTVFDRNRAFRDELCRIREEYASSLILPATSPFETSPTSFDCMVLYQNAFLETVNEIETNALLKRVFDLSKPEARIFFSYPVLGALATEGIIFTGNIPGAGNIDCRYAQYKWTGGMATARLAYTLKQEHDCYCVRVPLKFRVPELSSILVAAEQAGFSHKTSTTSDATPPILGNPVLVELRRH